MVLTISHHHAMSKNLICDSDATWCCLPLSVNPATTATAHLEVRVQELPSGRVSQPNLTHCFSHYYTFTRAQRWEAEFDVGGLRHELSQVPCLMALKGSLSHGVCR